MCIGIAMDSWLRSIATAYFQNGSQRYVRNPQCIIINTNLTNFPANVPHAYFSINTHLQSGKLVQKMFRKIQELIDDPDVLVCVLIDEVESLTAARKSAMSGSEPSDAIRVVNALLTQLDQIRRYPNVLILTTSNVTGAIDLAFVDRSAYMHNYCN